MTHLEQTKALAEQIRALAPPAPLRFVLVLVNVKTQEIGWMSELHEDDMVFALRHVVKRCQPHWWQRWLR